MIFISNNQTPIVLKPGKESLNFPTTFITPQLASIMILLLLIVAPIRANQLNTSRSQTLSERVAVVTFVSNQSFRSLSRTTSAFAWHSDVVQRLFEEFDFARERRVQVVSKRNTLAVDHHHPLRALAPFGLADAFTPFFARVKLPSTKLSDQSNWPFSSSSERKDRQASSQMSCSSQSFSLRQQVEGLGYRFGKSAQGAPAFLGHHKNSFR